VAHDSHVQQSAIYDCTASNDVGMTYRGTHKRLLQQLVSTAWSGLQIKPRFYLKQSSKSCTKVAHVCVVLAILQCLVMHSN
jgi:hypothetical protein